MLSFLINNLLIINIIFPQVCLLYILNFPRGDIYNFFQSTVICFGGWLGKPIGICYENMLRKAKANYNWCREHLKLKYVLFIRCTGSGTLLKYLILLQPAYFLLGASQVASLQAALILSILQARNKKTMNQPTTTH